MDKESPNSSKANKITDGTLSLATCTRTQACARRWRGCSREQKPYLSYGTLIEGLSRANRFDEEEVCNPTLYHVQHFSGWGQLAHSKHTCVRVSKCMRVHYRIYLRVHVCTTSERWRFLSVYTEKGLLEWITARVVKQCWRQRFTHAVFLSARSSCDAKTDVTTSVVLHASSRHGYKLYNGGFCLFWKVYVYHVLTLSTSTEVETLPWVQTRARFHISHSSSRA